MEFGTALSDYQGICRKCPGLAVKFQMKKIRKQRLDQVLRIAINITPSRRYRILRSPDALMVLNAVSESDQAFKVALMPLNLPPGEETSGCPSFRDRLA